jgi:microcystin-dependent protein
MAYSRPNGAERFQDLSANKQGLPSAELDGELNGLAAYVSGLSIIQAPVSEWQQDVGTPTHTSGTTFTLAGDQTAIYMTGRKLQFSLTGPLVYSTVVGSTYSGGTLLTTVTIEDSVLDPNLDIVWYGIISAGPESSLPTNQIPDDAVNYLHKDGSVALDNDSGVVGTNTVAAEWNVGKVNAVDEIEIGDENAPIVLNSSAAPLWDDGTSRAAILIPGEMKMWATDTFVPDGWLLCQGQEVSRTTYAALFANIGVAWGIGDGSTTFNLPDAKGRSPIGVGLGTATDATLKSIGDTGGFETHQLTVAELASHLHSYNRSNYANDNSGSLSLGIDGVTTSFNTDSTGGDTPHNNLSPYFAVNFIIKT